MHTEQQELVVDADSCGASLDDSHLSKNVLAAEAIRSLGHLRLRVTGSSMLPTLWPGDVLWIRRSSIGEVGIGDIVLFIRDRRLFAHRVIDRSEQALVTQGDALPMPDGCVATSELLGTVQAVLRDGHVVPLRANPSLPSRITMFLIRRTQFAARLLLRLHRLPDSGNR